MTSPIDGPVLAEVPLPDPPRPGDRVALVSPAGPAPAARIDRAAALLASFGYEPVPAVHLTAAHPRASYLAGSDAQRAADLTDAWMDPSIAAIFCIRGGYGSMRLIDLLDFEALATAAPKLLVGSSDITALHQVWNSRLGVGTLFAPMVATGDLLDGTVARRHLQEALAGAPGPRRIGTPHTEVMVPGEATGVLVGGNLAVLASAIGSGDLRRPAGAIGLLEDVTEDVYRLDRLMLQLRRSGWLGELSGLALGSWEQCGDPDEVKALMSEYVDPLGIPTLWNVGFGHCRDALSVPLGVRGRLLADPAAAPALMAGV